MIIILIGDRLCANRRSLADNRAVYPGRSCECGISIVLEAEFHHRTCRLHTDCDDCTSKVGVSRVPLRLAEDEARSLSTDIIVTDRLDLRIYSLLTNS